MLKKVSERVQYGAVNVDMTAEHNRWKYNFTTFRCRCVVAPPFPSDSLKLRDLFLSCFQVCPSDALLTPGTPIECPSALY